MDSRAEHAVVLTAFLKENNREKIIPLIEQLDAGCSEMETFFAEYDYDKVTLANGFRSFVKVVNKGFQLMVDVTNQAGNGKPEYGLMDECVAALSTLVKSLQIARLVRQKGVPFDWTEITDLDCKAVLIASMATEEDVRPFYSSIGPFWIEDDVRAQTDMHKRIVVSMTVPSLWEKMKVLMSDSYTSHVQVRNAVHMDVETLKNMANTNQFPTNFLIKLLGSPVGVRIISVEIETDNEWRIHTPDIRTHATISRGGRQRSKSISCLLIQPVNNRQANSLLMHSHGGGFVTASPGNFYRRLSEWSNELGVTILCPDYAKAPEHPYPSALQDILDVYMFLTSEREQVRETIGFHPNRIILTGDSAGGNLSIGLMIALNTIRIKGGLVVMPKGVSLQYPCASAGPIATPASALSLIDTTLPPAMGELIVRCYSPMDPAPAPGWKKRADANDVLKVLNYRMKDPLFNILAYRHFEDLRDIPLRVLVSEFDPILDQGIAITGQWKGSVAIHIARDLPHGFLFASYNCDSISRQVSAICTGITDLLS